MFRKDTLSPTEGKGRKFTRRQDLTPEKRLHIAFKALEGTWGTVTQLAGEFDISRPFVYMLRDELREIAEKIFGESKRFLVAQKKRIKKQAIIITLCLRLEGRCSIGATSQILKRSGGAKYNSVGWVSETLQFVGEWLPNTLVNDGSGVKLVIMACDEIFSHLRPILITVEPVSSAILRIELADSRQVAVWKEHWECIEDNRLVA